MLNYETDTNMALTARSLHSRSHDSTGKVEILRKFSASSYYFWASYSCSRGRVLVLGWIGRCRRAILIIFNVFHVQTCVGT